MLRTLLCLTSLALLVFADRSITGDGPVQVKEASSDDFLVAMAPLVEDGKKEELKVEPSQFKASQLSDAIVRLVRGINQQNNDAEKTEANDELKLKASQQLSDTVVRVVRDINQQSNDVEKTEANNELKLKSGQQLSDLTVRLLQSINQQSDDAEKTGVKLNDELKLKASQRLSDMAVRLLQSINQQSDDAEKTGVKLNDKLKLKAGQQLSDAVVRAVRDINQQGDDAEKTGVKLNDELKLKAGQQLTDMTARIVRSINQQSDDAEKESHGVDFNAFAKESHSPNVGKGQQLQAKDGFNNHINGAFAKFMENARVEHQKQKEEQDKQIKKALDGVFDVYGKMQKLKAQANKNDHSSNLVVAGTNLMGLNQKQGSEAENDDKMPIIFAAAVKLLNQERPVATKEDESKDDSTFARFKRFLNHGSVSRAVNFAFNRFDATKGPYSVATSGTTASFNYGSKKPTKMTVQVSMADDVHFVYGSECKDSKCRKTKVTTTFNENDNIGTGKKDRALNYNKGNDGYAKGFILIDSWGFQTGLKLNPFGVATTGDNNHDLVLPSASGYLGLGFKKYETEYNTVVNLFAAVDKKFIIIQRDKDLKAGSITVGGENEKCVNKKHSSLYDIQQDSSNNKQWWFKADTLSFGSKNDKGKIIAVDVGNDKVLFSKNYYDTVKDQFDNNGYVKDASKLQSLKITLGNDVLELKPEHYTYKENDKTKALIAQAPDNSGYEVLLGSPILRQYCVILNQDSAKDQKYKIGFTVPDEEKKGGSNGSASQAVSLMALLIVPLIQWLRV